MVYTLQELGRSMGEGTNVGQELERLQQQRKLMVENPEMQLTEGTKRLRQACFKANYKKRRLIPMSEHPSHDHDHLDRL